jgi:hypothetical protein
VGNQTAPRPLKIRDAIYLPARFAWLTRDIAIVFVRKTSLSAAALVAAALAARTSIIAFISAVTAAAVTTTAAARTAAGFLGTRFIYFYISAAHVFAVESRDGSRRFRVVDHFDETKTAGPASLAIHGHMNASQLAEGFEQRFQISRGSLETHVADEEVLHAVSLNEKRGPSVSIHERTLLKQNKMTRQSQARWKRGLGYGGLRTET